jgi:hypothetical protein
MKSQELNQVTPIHDMKEEDRARFSSGHSAESGVIANSKAKVAADPFTEVKFQFLRQKGNGQIAKQKEIAVKTCNTKGFRTQLNASLLCGNASSRAHSAA